VALYWCRSTVNGETHPGHVDPAVSRSTTRTPCGLQKCCQTRTSVVRKGSAGIPADARPSPSAR
jgi:hypothetical protein